MDEEQRAALQARGEKYNSETESARLNRLKSYARWHNMAEPTRVPKTRREAENSIYWEIIDSWGWFPEPLPEAQEED